MSDENLEALKRLYGRWGVGNFRDESSLYDPHVVGISPDPSPEAQYGLPAMRDYMRRFVESWEHVRFEAKGYRQVGDTVVVNVHRTGIGKGSGAKLEDDAFHVWTFRGGKAIRVDVFDREAEALEAAGLSE